MSRRGRRRPASSPGDAGAVAPVYEGPEALEALLARAGTPLAIGELADRFARAVAAGEPRAAVIPALFAEEPRFASPDEARRLYANLFGLWARIAAGLGPHDDAPELVPEPPPAPPLPERGLSPGRELTVEVVDAVWRNLAAASPREAQRARDRYAGAQPDLAAWLDAVPLPEAGALAAADLVFEAWAMLDQAFGERLGAAPWRLLRALEAEPPPLETTQPALAPYAAEQLDVVGDETAGFGPAERAQVERAVAAAVAALTASLREPS